MVRVRHLTLAALLGIGVIAHAGLSAGASSSDPSTSPLAARPPHEPTPETPLNIITFDSAASTCIGKPVTPLCAVETLLACFVRGGYSLCRSAFWSKAKAEWFAAKRHPNDIIKYRVRSTERLTRQTIPVPGWNPEGIYAEKPGDVIVILEIFDCGAVTPMCEAPEFGPPRMTYYVARRSGKHWWVIEQNTPRE